MLRCVLAFAFLTACDGTDPAGVPEDAGDGDAGAMPPADAGPADAGPGDAGPPPSTDAPPPPISGGTLLVTAGGARAIAADADRHVVWIVELAAAPSVRSIALLPGDEPGRLVEDAAGRIHVALRAGGAVATIDPAAGSVLFRRDVCPAPRGIAFRGGDDALVVACAGGELVTLPAAGGEPTAMVRLDSDLRDVVVDGDRLLVTRFRHAELLVVEGDTVTARFRPLDATVSGRAGATDLVPNVAYRVIPRPGGGAFVLHQRATASELLVERGGYSGATDGCFTGVVSASVSTFDGSTMPGPGPMFGSTVLAVDLALSPDGLSVAIVDAAQPNAVLTYPASRLAATSVVDCPDGEAIHVPLDFTGTAVAAAFTADSLLVQYREPAVLLVHRPFEPPAVIDFRAPTVRHVGHDLFHQGTPSMMACASCHPEGGEDGHVWDLSGTRRRTQTLVGGLLATAPFHWSGDQPDLSAIMQATFVERMRGVEPTPAQITALGAWLDAQPALPPSIPDSAAAARGAEVFESSGCATCHFGALYTDNRTVDVGTGGAFQVPSLLGVGHRAPYQHDGCAPTLEDVLSASCSTPEAHVPSTFDAAARADLAAFLRSL